MKTKLLPILRYIVLALLLLCIVLCRFFPVMAEGYARHIYPWLSAALSAIASVFPFSLEEVLVVVIILWMIIYPFLKRRKKKKLEIHCGQGSGVAGMGLYLVLSGVGFELFPLRYLPADGGGTCRLR